MEEKWNLLYEKHKHIMKEGDTASASFTTQPPFIWSSSKEFIEAMQKEFGGYIEEETKQFFKGWYLNITTIL